MNAASAAKRRVAHAALAVVADWFSVTTMGLTISALFKRLLGSCVEGARALGYRRMVLWTHESHAAAGHLYRVHGFTLECAKPVRSFGVDLVEQSWSITL